MSKESTGDENERNEMSAINANENVRLDKAITSAVQQLRKSERGQQVLRDVKSLIENGAAGLDSQNMIAMCVLIESVRVGKVGTVLEEIGIF